MRRIPRIPAGENPVKDKREELTLSVNREQARLESLQHDSQVAADDLEHIIEKRGSAAEDLEDVLKKIEVAKTDLNSLDHQKSDLVIKVKSAQSDLDQAKSGIVLAKQQAKEIIHASQEQADRLITATESKVESIKKSILGIQSELDSVAHECGKKKIELDQLISNSRNEIVILLKLDQQVSDRKRDLVNLDNAIVKRESLLADVQERVRQAHHNETDLNAEIEWQQKVLRDLEAQIEKKQEEDHLLDDRKIEFAKKEIRFTKAVDRLKELYVKSGIPFDLEV
jgi:chromosome segregation ATPase